MCFAILAVVSANVVVVQSNFFFKTTNNKQQTTNNKQQINKQQKQQQKKKAVNLVLTPVDLFLIPFFVRLGEWAVGAETGFSITVFMDSFQESKLNAIMQFQTALLYGVLGWLVTTPFILIVAYYASFPLFKVLVSHRKK